MTPALRIAARRAGFRRAGIAHPATPVTHPAGTFTAEQVEALLAERMLVVEVLADGDGSPPASADAQFTAATGSAAAPAADAHPGAPAATTNAGETGGAGAAQVNVTTPPAPGRDHAAAASPVPAAPAAEPAPKRAPRARAKG